MVALSQIRCLLTRRPAPFPPTFWVSWPTTRHVTKTTLRVVTRPCVSKYFFLPPTAKRNIRFFFRNPLHAPVGMMRIGERGQRFGGVGRCPAKNDRDSQPPPAALFIPTFRLRATMSDTSAGRMAFIASWLYLIGVSLSDLVSPRPEMVDGMATKASSPWSCSVLLAISISCFDVCHKNRSILDNRTSAPCFFLVFFFPLQMPMSRTQDIGFGFCCWCCV